MSTAASNRTPLGELQHDWGSAYRISRTKRTLTARRRDDDQPLEAEDAEALRELIHQDYQRRPVPRPPAQRPAPDSAPDGAIDFAAPAGE